MKLSVIIPIYNAAATLDRCVASVVACPAADMEVILVDDGSTDQSPLLCEQWQKRDTRISVIHKANGGLSDARNYGIEAAQGDYLTFVDSDDYLTLGTLESLMATADSHPEYDLIEYPANQHEGAPKESLLTFKDRIYTDVSRYWYDTQAYTHAYACNKLYRRCLFRTVRFPVGRVFEDIWTLPRLLSEAKVVATTAKGLYHYCHNRQGITAQASAAEWLMLLESHMQIAHMPAFTAYNDAQYYQHLVNIQIYANELSSIAPVVPDMPYYDARNPKSILRHIIGIKKLCKLNRIFRKIVRRRS